MFSPEHFPDCLFFTSAPQRGLCFERILSGAYSNTLRPNWPIELPTSFLSCQGNMANCPMERSLVTGGLAIVQSWSPMARNEDLPWPCLRTIQNYNNSDNSKLLLPHSKVDSIRQGHPLLSQRGLFITCAWQGSYKAEQKREWTGPQQMLRKKEYDRSSIGRSFSENVQGMDKKIRKSQMYLIIFLFGLVIINLSKTKVSILSLGKQRFLISNSWNKGHLHKVLAKKQLIYKTRS